jgi:glutamate synthase domain-containing protein 2/nitrite reductase/ring-hydroxylating ferredoxin subunit
MRPVLVARLSELKINQPHGALVESVDLVVIRLTESEVSVLHGRCHHRGALLADGHVSGNNLICGVHGWDYRIDTGISEYNNAERLHKFSHVIAGDEVLVDGAEVAAWAVEHPQPFRRDEYLGAFADTHPIPEEDRVWEIQHLAQHGLTQWGHHGHSVAMGVERTKLPRWDDIQILTAQFHRLPKFDHEPVATEVVIGPRAARPLRLAIPLLVSDMSFGSLSEEAKISLARGAEMAGTGICSGEGGMLEEEKAENSRYFYELASGRFGFSEEKLTRVQAFHFKGGQGAKTGTGGHLPGSKVQGKIADVRKLPPGTPAISPARFHDLVSPHDFRVFADRVRELAGGIPIGFKISAQQIEKDIDFALDAGADYIILDGRGGGTGSAPSIFRDHISVPTIPALVRARRHLDKRCAGDVTLIITGGLRTAPDFVKALALGADAIALSNSAMQAIGCIAMRACQSNNCPVGIATQKDHLRARLEIAKSALRLKNFLTASTELMAVMARACGHDRLDGFQFDDLTTFNETMHRLTGIAWAGGSDLSFCD